ncbi:vWA domain-containing protein [Maricaulis sp. CAU 1757]
MKRHVLLSGGLGLLVAACAASTVAPPPPSPPPPPPPAAYPSMDMVAVTGARGMEAETRPATLVPQTVDTERYPDADPNPVLSTLDEPVSTFSIDVDTASYALARSSLQHGSLPPRDAVRIEEIVNYFDYDYALPDGPDTPFATHVTLTPTPWNADTRLLHIGIQGYEIIPDERPRANLVFLIDVSGSMNAPNKLPLALQALHMLVDQLEPDDTVALVVYAGAAGAVLEPTPARERTTIHRALDRLSAGGSTAGGAGLALAYDLAERNFDPEAVNRVMLLTDGDFNVGVTQDERLEDFVARKRDSGIYLSVMGFGRGNYNDRMMQVIAQAGNGVAGYVDTRQEARRLLVEESFSSLFPIAEDVKIQVEFNPAHVAEYRLIGYETRLLDRADFNNDAVDAGEVGSGHSVTAIYEIAAPGSDGLRLEPLRYGGAVPAMQVGDEVAHLRLRYKRPGEDDSRLIERAITEADAVGQFDAAPMEVRFSASIAGFAQALRGDPYLDDSYDWTRIRDDAAAALGPDEFGYRAEFLDLVDAAARVSAGPLKP